MGPSRSSASAMSALTTPPARPNPSIRDIEIHGGCNNWYIEVAQPPKSYRVDIGYVSKRGQFYVLARSNVVCTPKAGVSDTIDENWADLDPQTGRSDLRHVQRLRSFCRRQPRF